MKVFKLLVKSFFMCALMFTPGVLFIEILPWTSVGYSVLFCGGMAYQHYLTSIGFGTLRQALESTSAKDSPEA